MKWQVCKEEKSQGLYKAAGCDQETPTRKGLVSPWGQEHIGYEAETVTQAEGAAETGKGQVTGFSLHTLPEPCNDHNQGTADGGHWFELSSLDTETHLIFGAILKLRIITTSFVDEEAEI